MCNGRTLRRDRLLFPLLGGGSSGTPSLPFDRDIRAARPLISPCFLFPRLPLTYPVRHRFTSLAVVGAASSSPQVHKAPKGGATPSPAG